MVGFGNTYWPKSPYWLINSIWEHAWIHPTVHVSSDRIGGNITVADARKYGVWKNMSICIKCTYGAFGDVIYSRKSHAKQLYKLYYMMKSHFPLKIELINTKPFGLFYRLDKCFLCYFFSSIELYIRVKSIL